MHTLLNLNLETIPSIVAKELGVDIIEAIKMDKSVLLIVEEIK
jgi:hypothetical protein